MSETKIIWTALPCGFHDGRPRLSVFVSPRLTSTTSRLDEFPDFLDWPERINAMTFTVETSDGQQLECERVSVTADSSLWKALFRADTFVEPFQFKDFSERAIRSMPVRGIAKYVNDLYGHIAKVSPDELPKLFHEDDDDPNEVGALTPLLRDVGSVLPLDVSDFAEVLVDHDEEETAQVLSLPQEMRGLASVLRKAPITIPQAEELRASHRFTALDSVLSERRVIDTRVEESHGFASKVGADFYQAHRFYDRPEDLMERVPEVDLAKVRPRPEVPRIDFHKMLALLGDHPYLMRKLGIVVDLATGDLPAPGQIRVRAREAADHPLQATTHVSPWTSFARTADAFLPASRSGSDVADGMLRLEAVNDDPDSTDTDFDLLQVDLDGAALKAVNLAVTGARNLVKERVSRIQAERPDVAALLGRAEVSAAHISQARSMLLEQQPAAFAERMEGERAKAAAPPRAGLPSLRSTGIAIARAGRAAVVADRLKTAAESNAQSSEDDIVHFADDLVRGYRVDVFDDETGQWHSLCKRIGNYRLQTSDGSWVTVTAADGSSDVHEEGYVKGSTASSDGDEDADLYLHEALFRWDGWSLAAPRPGRTIRAEVDHATGHQREIVERPKPELKTEFQMESSFRVEPGTLPRLRFGRTYKVRARCVDLAGNSLELGEAGDAHATETITYVRFDPVVPPVLVPRARFTEGESLERVVIRSNFDVSAEAYPELAPVKAALEGAAHVYAPANDRHVVPPKTSQLMAECHGAFEEAIGTGKPHHHAYQLSVREAGTLDHSHVVEGEDADGHPVYKKLPGTEMIPGTPPAGSNGADAPGAYLVNTQGRFPLTYLPDWPAEGIVLRGLPGTDDAFVHVYEGDWPDLEPFVVRVVEREGTLDPPGCVQELTGDGKPVLKDGVLTVFLPKGEVASVRYSSLLKNTEPHRMGQTRWLRDGNAEPSAELIEIVERGDHWMFTPSRELILVHATQQPLCPPEFLVIGGSQPQADAAKRLGETFATFTGVTRMSVKTTGQVDLLARWDEPKDLLSDPTWKMIGGASHVTTLPVDARLPEPEVSIPFPGTDGRPIHHEFGDTKHRWVNYRLVGTTRFREYFPAALTKDPANITRTGAEARVNVLSSARPDAPRVEYVVPSFKWEEKLDESGGWKLERTRRGGGLRVYLQRPWFSSGEGELLGVVLWTKEFEALVSPARERFRGLVSMFGKDPIWASASPDPALDRSYFPEERPYEEGLSLDETAEETVGVVGFEPEFDEARKLWFCDVELAWKAQRSYYPFIRMALARYQPDSLPEAKLSRVVQTDFAQVVPDRRLTVTKTGERRFDVTVYGPAPDGPFPNRVEVEIQTHGRIPGELGWNSVPGNDDRPNPVVLARGLPDKEWAPEGLSVELLESVVSAAESHLVAGAHIGLSRIGTAVEAGPAVEEAVVERARAVEPGVAMHFAEPIDRSNFPVVDAIELGHVAKRGVPDALLPKLPAFLLEGYETWSGSVTIPDDAGEGPFRILVCEFETFPADPEVGKIDADRVEPVVDGPYLDRIVYADIVELPA